MLKRAIDSSNILKSLSRFLLNSFLDHVANKPHFFKHAIQHPSLLVIIIYFNTWS